LVIALGPLALSGVAGTAAAQRTVLRVLKTLGDASEATCIAGDEHELWIGTMGAGLFRLRGLDARPERFDSTRGVMGNRVNDCIVSEGHTWVATDSGLSQLDPIGQRFILIDAGRHMKMAAGAGLVIAARGDGFIRRFIHGAMQPAVLIPVVASALAVSSDGSRYAVGGIDGSLMVVTGTALPRPVALPEPAGGVRLPIERLAFRGHDLVVETASDAFAVDSSLHVEKRGPAQPDDEPALHGSLIHARKRIGSAEVIATDTGAFLRAAPGAALTRIALDGLPCGARISALAVQGDALWIGSFDRGLCRLDANGVISHFAGPKYLPSDLINALASDDQRLYVATDAGLVIVEAGDKFTQFTHQQCVGKLSAPCPWHAAVNGVAVDAGLGSVWVADIGALHEIDPRTGAWQHPGTRAVLGSQAVTRVAAFGGLVAIGTSDRGVLLWDAEHKRTRVLDDQHGLADNWVTDLAFDASGRLWIGTCTHGVSVRDVDGHVRSFTTANGLIDDYVLSVQDVGGRIWIGTLRGATLIDTAHASERALQTSKWQYVTALEARFGLSGSEIHDAVQYRGQVWVATDGGVSAVEASYAPGDGKPL
jgi:ligand-binding sensor domain-containing protein